MPNGHKKEHHNLPNKMKDISNAIPVIAVILISGKVVTIFGFKNKYATPDIVSKNIIIAIDNLNLCAIFFIIPSHFFIKDYHNKKKRSFILTIHFKSLFYGKIIEELGIL